MMTHLSRAKKDGASKDSKCLFYLGGSQLAAFAFRRIALSSFFSVASTLPLTLLLLEITAINACNVKISWMGAVCLSVDWPGG